MAGNLKKDLVAIRVDSTEDPNYTRRSEEQLLLDRQILMELKLKHPAWTSQQIATEFERQTGVSVPARTVRYDLKKVREEWAKSHIESYTQYVQQELVRIDITEQEAWDAWRKSMGDQVRKIIERVAASSREKAHEIARDVSNAVAGDLGIPPEELEDLLAKELENWTVPEEDGAEPNMAVTKVTEHVVDSPGDVSFLKMIHELQRERRKILGLYAPELLNVRVEQQVEVKGYGDSWNPSVWSRDVVEGELVNE